jgi:Protein of unknown function (DUF3540)
MAKARSARRGEIEGEGEVAPSVEAATIVELGDDADRARVRIAGADGKTVALDARVALIAGYRPSVGDRVLVARDRTEVFVVGVLAAAGSPVLALADGTTARVEGGAIELRDGEGRLLVRHEPGVTTIVAPERDLKLAAPHGRVVIEGGTDVAIHAARDLQHGAGRRIELAAGVAADEPQLRLDGKGARVETPRLDVRTRGAHVVTAEASVVARTIATTAEHLALNVERYELTAQRLVEKTRDAFRDVKDLLQERVGRAKVIVRGAYALQTNRTTMVSKEETSVDGKKILLG